MHFHFILIPSLPYNASDGETTTNKSHTLKIKKVLGRWKNCIYIFIDKNVKSLELNWQVCRACALEKDFKQFPYSDQTLVGERGVSLSGGQRARINLARSVYREVNWFYICCKQTAHNTRAYFLLFITFFICITMYFNINRKIEFIWNLIEKFPYKVKFVDI